MKLKFKETVKDKYTKEYYQANTAHEFEEARAKEILATGYAELVEEINENAEDETPDEALDNGKLVNLDDLSKNKLIELAKEHGLDTKGTKEELIERLLEAKAE